MPNKIDISMWFKRIDSAEDLQSTVRKERLQAIKLYTSSMFGNPTIQGEANPLSDITDVNFVYEYCKVLIGSVYARDPHIFVRSRSNKYSDFAQTMEQVINYYWYELQMKRKIKQAILDAVLIPPGFIEIGYKLLTEKKLREDIFDLEPQKKEKVRKTEEEYGIFDETIKDDNVFANHISSWNVLWPDGYHNIRECPYMIIKQSLSVGDVIANPMFKRVKFDLLNQRGVRTEGRKRFWPFTMKSNPDIVEKQIYGGDLEYHKITLYHCFDKRTRERFVLTKKLATDTLYTSNWDYLTDGFTIYPLIFNEIPQTDEKSNSYPMSDIVPMLPQLKELSLLSSAINRHRKRSGTVILAKRGNITPSDITNIQNSKDVDIIEVENTNDYQGFTPPALPNDFYAMREIILQDLMRVSGFQQLLFSARGVETATESENIRAGALIRQSEKQDIIEDFTTDIARGLSGLIWQYIQEKERIEEIIGEPVNERMWPALPEDSRKAREMIQRELNFRIDAGSTRPPKDEALERKQWLDLTGSIKASFPDRVKDDVYLKQLLKKFDFHDIEDMIITFDEEEKRVAMQENQLLMQNQQQLASPNENHILHIQIHGQASMQGSATQALDQHILQHANYLKQKYPKAQAQSGDLRPPRQTTTPEMQRQGVPEGIDLLGRKGTTSGVGGNKGKGGL